MATQKGNPKKGMADPPAGIYRDAPEYAETASMSSAVLMNEVETFPDEDLPAYEDTPSQSSHLLGAAPVTGPSIASINNIIYRPDYLPPDPVFSSHDKSRSEYRTNLPNYSTEPGALAFMIKDQAKYAPGYYVRVCGTHTQTTRRNNKDERTTVTDFDFKLSLADMILPQSYVAGMTPGELEFLPDNRRGYRGTRFPSLSPAVAPIDGVDSLTAWCEHYVANTSSIKSFTLKREVRWHMTERLERLIRSAVSETNYRGHVSVTFPTTHTSLIVYSPGKINQWRMTTWIRWFFYLSCLWIIAWPILFLITARYEVVKSVWYYWSDELTPLRERSRMMELDWYQKWYLAIKRAARSRVGDRDAVLSEDFLLASIAAEQRNRMNGGVDPAPVANTGNAIADGALNFLGHGIRVASEINQSVGWGYDC